MRGPDCRLGDFVAYINLAQRVRPKHPLRPVWELANGSLATLSGEFSAPYSKMGRPNSPGFPGE